MGFLHVKQCFFSAGLCWKKVSQQFNIVPPLLTLTTTISPMQEENKLPLMRSWGQTTERKLGFTTPSILVMVFILRRGKRRECSETSVTTHYSTMWYRQYRWCLDNFGFDLGIKSKLIYAYFLKMSKYFCHHCLFLCHVCRIVMLIEVVIAGSFMTAYIGKFALFLDFLTSLGVRLLGCVLFQLGC